MTRRLLILVILLFFSCLTGGCVTDVQAISMQQNMVTAESVNQSMKEGEPLELNNAVIIGDLDLSHYHLNQTMQITSSIINGSWKFFDTSFENGVIFENTTFLNNTDFRNSHFNAPAIFENATFKGNADFGNSQFENYVFFNRALFDENANFRMTNFGHFAYFENTSFNRNAIFASTKFNERAFFSNAIFVGDADFKNAKFSDFAWFNGIQFKGNATFQIAQFNRFAVFSQANFNGDAQFYQTQFSADAFFDKTKFQKNLYLSQSRFDRLYVSWGSIKDNLVYDGSVYLALVKNYKDLQQFNDSDECYFNYMEKRDLRGVAGVWWLLDSMYWLFGGYGVNPYYPLGWSIFIIIAFGILFSWAKGIRKFSCVEDFKELKENGQTTKGTTNGSKLIEERVLFIEESPKFYDPILFSLTTFTSGVLSFLYPSTEFVPVEKYPRGAVILEKLLGSLFIALLISTILHAIIR